MTRTMSIGLKFGPTGLRVDGPVEVINKRAELIIDRVAGSLALKFGDKGSVFCKSRPGHGQAHFGMKHLGNIRLYNGQYTKYDAVVTADGLVIRGFVLPPVNRKQPRNKKSKREGCLVGAVVAKPKSKTWGKGHSVDKFVIDEISSALRLINRKGREAGVVWSIEDGKVVGNMNIKRQL